MMQFNPLNSSPVNASLMKKAGNECCSLFFGFDEIDDSIRILRRGDRPDLGLTFRLLFDIKLVPVAALIHVEITNNLLYLLIIFRIASKVHVGSES